MLFLQFTSYHLRVHRLWHSDGCCIICCFTTRRDISWCSWDDGVLRSPGLLRSRLLCIVSSHLPSFRKFADVISIAYCSHESINGVVKYFIDDLHISCAYERKSLVTFPSMFFHVKGNIRSVKQWKYDNLILTFQTNLRVRESNGSR